jgi:hypothetical protein
MVTPFDALIDAIVHYSGYRIPGSPAYKARNPGALKAFSPAVPRDEMGLRIFKCDIDGMNALKFDVRHKIAGKAKRKCATLAELAAAYDLKPMQAKAWAGFIRQALGVENIDAKTPLTFFQEQK